MEPANIISPASVAPAPSMPAFMADPAPMPTMQPVTPTPTSTGPSGQGGPGNGFKDFLSKYKWPLIIGGLILVLLINLGISAWLYQKMNKYSTLTALGLKQTNNSSGANVFNGDDTLYIDTKTKSVGVGAASPEGLQIDSNVTTTARNTANLRAGLLNGQPTIVFENKSAQQLQFGMSGTAFQFASGSNTYAQVDGNGLNLNNGGITAGGSSTLGGSALFVDANNGIAVGGNKTNGYKLYVSGNAFASSLQTSGQITVPADSAKTPAITFAGNTNTGIFSPATNITSISAGGTEVLRAQPGNVAIMNGAGLNVDGFLQAGSGDPAWKIARYTGTLDGSGTAVFAHGISNGQSRVIMAMAWYQGSSGQAKYLSIDYIDGTNMQVSGGTPGNVPFRAAIIYTSDTAGW